MLFRSHARRNALADGGRELYRALADYRASHRAYPATHDQVLRIADSLPEGALIRYASRRSASPSGDFWALLAHRSDPRIVVLVAETDEYPGHEGEKLSGVYRVDEADLRLWTRGDEAEGLRASLRQ